MAKTLVKGNHAVGEAAVRAGLELFAGYPITPSTEIMEYLSGRLPELGRVFIQAENEIASIHMVGGAYCTGHRAMTASSAGGFTLMQEFTAYAADAELPYVIVNVVRSGRGIGSLQSGQDCYRQCVYGGGNGDYRQIVFIPNSIQEMVDMVYESFDVAEKYQIGVIINTEASMGQMMEAVEYPPFKEMGEKPEWAIDGNTKWKWNAGQEDLKRPVYAKKIADIEAEMQRYETYMVEDAERVVIAAGLPSRSCFDAVKKLRAKGEKVGFIRPKAVFPFPVNAFKEVNPNVKEFLCIETTEFGEMVHDVALTVKKVFPNNIPVKLYPYGIGIPSVAEVLDKYEEMIKDDYKEVF